MTHSRKAHGAGQGAPKNDEGPAVAAVALQESKRNESPDSQAAPVAGQALRATEGEGKAEQFLARLHDLQADPDELALIVSMLYGATLRGFCRVIANAVRVHHG